MDKLIYKICSEIEWEKACACGLYSGSADDKRDGFIHFSTRDQVKRTLAKHFTGQAGLILLAVDVSLLNNGDIKYEGAEGGQEFPHLYGGFSPSAVQTTYKIRLNENKEHDVEF